MEGLNNIASFGYWVERRRKALDLTRAGLAEQVGCSPVTIKKIERDERRPSLEMAELLADHLLVPEAERDQFLQMGCGKFVAAMPSPLGDLPTLPQFPEDTSEQEEAPPLFVAREEARSFELRAATSLSRLWRDQGKKEEAHQLLAEIYGWFTEGFDTADLIEAKEPLNELENKSDK